MSNKIIHTTIGVYPNSEFKMNGVRPEHLEDHIEYNIKHRPGRALFVDSKCVNRGDLSWNEIESFILRIEIEDLIKTKYSDKYV